MNNDPFNRRGYDPRVGQRFTNSYDVVTGVPVAAASPAVRAAFLNKVYMTFCVGVLIAIATAFYLVQGAREAIQSGTGNALTNMIRMGNGGYLLLFFVYVMVGFAAQLFSRVKGVNVIIYAAFTALTGAVIAPLMLSSALKSGNLDVIWNAFGLTALTFGALTGYVLISGKDFSFMGGMLTIGLFVLFGFMVATIFFHSPVFYMGVTAGGLFLFGLFVLYDTSVIIHHLAPNEWMAGALSLFLDFINMFIRILALLSDRR